MTSSLVGSEMCIRDRPRTVQRQTTKQRLPEPLQLASRGCACLAWQISAPVSYTHLTLPTICSV
eukprot:11783513-Prorocentrum_lima.AAC.1